MLELLIKDCMNLKEKVNILSKYYTTCRIKVEKAQDIMDSVLRSTYPYISETEGWTKMKSIISKEHSMTSIKIFPLYLPFGYEDATRVKIGIKVDDADGSESIIKANIWRDKDNVFATVDGLEEGVFNKRKIEEAKNSRFYDEETSVIDFNIILKTNFLVLDSTDSQERKKIGHYLGPKEVMGSRTRTT